MAKRPTVAEKLLARIDARIAALRLAREELLALQAEEAAAPDELEAPVESRSPC